VLVESAQADLPADVRSLLESGAATIQQAAALYRNRGSLTLADLLADVRHGVLACIPGLDQATASAIEAALPRLRDRLPRVSLGRAVAGIEPILDQLRAQPSVAWASPVGSLRRGQDSIGDVEIVAATHQAGDVLADLGGMVNVEGVRHRSAERIYLHVDRLQVGVRCLAPDAAGAALLQLTGSQAHLTRLRQLAAARGCSLDGAGLRTRDGRLIAAEEDDIYRALGLPFIAPEIRDGADELDAAAEGRLPRLVEQSDLRGDLHMHTTWSDGRDSVEDMVQAAVALGYEYVAITDHSPSSAASRNLSLDGVARQADEIAAVRERYPQIQILHGVEVDILPDGRLDFSDRVLCGFDIVLASLHERAGHGVDELMRRYLGAMLHPLVSIITHPTNRLVPQRPGYDLHYRRLFEAAVETRTVLEIDGAPTHLDLDGALAREAVRAGALLSIDSDSHRSDMLRRQMQLGVTTARRGWVEAGHVVNARPVREIRALVAAKRRS
jgi:DNA polymerase (family 10)